MTAEKRAQHKASVQEQLARDYADPQHRRCHQCERELPLENILELADGGVVVQRFTGRLFCYPACWNQYLEGEGLK